MEEAIRKLYDLAKDGEVVDSFDVLGVLGLQPVWGCEGGFQSDSVADLAASIEESLSQGYENDTP